MVAQAKPKSLNAKKLNKVKALFQEQIDHGIHQGARRLPLR